MAAAGAYIFSVTATAMLCAMLNALLQGCSVQKYVKLVCSVVLFSVVIHPLASWSDLEKIEFSIPRFPEGNSLVSGSIADSQNAMADIIKQNTQTYIEDKAACTGLEVQAEVVLSRDSIPVPTAVTLYGSAAPYLKLKLEEILQEELNIAKENLVWIG